MEVDAVIADEVMEDAGPLTTPAIPAVDGMMVDEEPAPAPVLTPTPECHEVVMEEGGEEEENEEDMEDVPSTPAFPPPPCTLAADTTMLSPPSTPIVLNMAPGPSAPKLDRRFIVDTTPTLPTYNIHALNPDYRPPRKLDALPRIKEVYGEEFEDNDGYRQKLRWSVRGLPDLDESAVLQLELLMNDGAEGANQDWQVHQAGIDEQAAIDQASRKERFEAKKNARIAAYRKYQQEKKEKGPSMFIQKKKH
ncbi:hypothetical protein F4859DRAFT_493298 [Xylaria cf. heliscus]|nr:hypothetical protein F4859DRAFT_493298 [Xylaria cf. heliscus]